MPELRRFVSRQAPPLPEEALRLDTPQEFLRDHLRLPDEAIHPAIDLGGVDELIASTMAAHAAGDTAMDRAIAIPLHRALRLPRRLAADRRIWAWLGTMRYADFVAHRWPKGATSGVRAAERFTGDRVRQAIARLWWAAELTWSPQTGYALTEEMMSLGGFQDLYEAMAGRAFCGYPPAVRAFIKAVGGKPERTIRQVARELSYVLTTMVLETMSEEAITELLAELVDLSPA